MKTLILLLLFYFFVLSQCKDYPNIKEINSQTCVNLFNGNLQCGQKCHQYFNYCFENYSMKDNEFIFKGVFELYGQVNIKKDGLKIKSLEKDKLIFKYLNPSAKNEPSGRKTQYDSFPFQPGTEDYMFIINGNNIILDNVVFQNVNQKETLSSCGIGISGNDLVLSNNKFIGFNQALTIGDSEIHHNNLTVTNNFFEDAMGHYSFARDGHNNSKQPLKYMGGNKDINKQTNYDNNKADGSFGDTLACFAYKNITIKSNTFTSGYRKGKKGKYNDKEVYNIPRAAILIGTEGNSEDYHIDNNIISGVFINGIYVEGKHDFQSFGHITNNVINGGSVNAIQVGKSNNVQVNNNKITIACETGSDERSLVGIQIYKAYSFTNVFENRIEMIECYNTYVVYGIHIDPLKKDDYIVSNLKDKGIDIMKYLGPIKVSNNHIMGDFNAGINVYGKGLKGEAIYLDSNDFTFNRKLKTNPNSAIFLDTTDGININIGIKSLSDKDRVYLYLSNATNIKINDLESSKDTFKIDGKDKSTVIFKDKKVKEY